MGGRTEVTATPTALQSHMHTSGSLAGRTRKCFLSKAQNKQKKENTTSTKTKSQELQGAESRTMSSPKLGRFSCLEESPGKHAPFSKAKDEGVFKPMAGMGDDELWG